MRLRSIGLAVLLGLGILAGALSSGAFASARPSSVGVIHYMRTVGQSRGQAKRTSAQLVYGGGAVETAPEVFVVFWGTQWTNNDPSGEASILESFYSGVGGSSWENTDTQYCQGAAVGATTCKRGTIPVVGNPIGELANADSIWYDTQNPAPAKPLTSDLAAEALAAAAHFGYSAQAQYVIATATGNNSAGFGADYCALHSSSPSPSGDVAWTDLPYITDAGANCGANFNGLGPNAGITIIAGHELAEAATDPFPSSGWLDSNGAELADKCVFIGSGQGAAANVTLPTGNFPVQSLWSNAFNHNKGGCVLSYP
jgi:serine protease